MEFYRPSCVAIGGPSDGQEGLGGEQFGKVRCLSTDAEFGQAAAGAPDFVHPEADVGDGTGGSEGGALGLSEGLRVGVRW